MAGLKLFSGNRLDFLAHKFSETIASSPLPPMEEEVVVLQSLGMMKWLSIMMSDINGIWANSRYVFPNKMIGEILDSFLGSTGSGRFFDKELMTWSTMKEIICRMEDPLFEELSSYARSDTSGLRLFQIASRIVDVFDQYMTFRPDMILEWDAGQEKEKGWQPELWRALTAGSAYSHPPALLEKFYQSVNDDGFTSRGDLPSRISVFGISYMPLYHFNILRGIAEYIDVYFYILNPSFQYWGDILREKEISRIISSGPITAGEPEEELHLEKGNSLLASMGRVGRDFFHYLLSSDIFYDEVFEEPGASTLLEMIQHDIYTMTDRGSESPESVHCFSEDEISRDNSIVISSCHGPMREVEALHDHLLDLFSCDNSLEPKDVLVMTPDIEGYSSYIQAVFDRSRNTAMEIPYSIADRTMRDTSPLVEAFFRVLDLNDGRFTANEIISLAGCREIMDRFEFDDDDLDKIRMWVRDTSIFWGYDSSYRESIGLPGCADNTWQQGLKQMIIGTIMPDEGRISEGVLPYDQIEGSDALLLGRFITLVETLRKIQTMLDGLKKTGQWGDLLTEVIELLFGQQQDPSDELLTLAGAAAALKEQAEDPGFDELIGAAVIREYLDKKISERTSVQNFISGRVTFCEMLPMRSIPYRVICMVGMNDYLFPRKARPLGFNIMVRTPRRGDRSARDEDRYLFLETLISVRDKLYISYTGQNINDNSELNPSILVHEMLDYIDHGFSVEGGNSSVKDYIFRRHKLQPFSTEYFNGDKLFSYSAVNFENACSSIEVNSGSNSKPFISSGLPDPDDSLKFLTPASLVNFLVNPSRFLLSGRLGIYMDIRDSGFNDDEVFIPGPLENYSVKNMILQAMVEERDMSGFYDTVKFSGLLPHGVPGSVYYKRALEEAGAFFKTLEPLISPARSEASVDLHVGNLNIAGRISSIYGGRNIYYRFGKARARDFLTAWVSHILLCESDCDNFHGSTVLYTVDREIEWQRADDSREILENLAAVYNEGLIRPVPVFEKSSFSYADEFYSSSEEPGRKAMGRAMMSFQGTQQMDGDCLDPYVQRLFGEYRLDREFESLAMKIYGPVFENIKGGLE